MSETRNARGAVEKCRNPSGPAAPGRGARERGMLTACDADVDGMRRGCDADADGCLQMRTNVDASHPTPCRPAAARPRCSSLACARAVRGTCQAMNLVAPAKAVAHAAAPQNGPSLRKAQESRRGLGTDRRRTGFHRHFAREKARKSPGMPGNAGVCALSAAAKKERAWRRAVPKAVVRALAHGLDVACQEGEDACLTARTLALWASLRGIRG